jgi:hypothetical protein
MVYTEAELTRSSLSPFVDPRLVPPDALAESLVACYDGDNGEERGDEAEGGPDVPPFEDDAEVLGFPGEEHLRCRSLLLVGVLSNSGWDA